MGSYLADARLVGLAPNLGTYQALNADIVACARGVD